MKRASIAMLIALSIVAVFAARSFIPAVGIDWFHFRDAGRAVLNGTDPYVDSSFYNAPWLAAILIPFAVQDDVTGNALLFAAGFAAFAYIALRFGAQPVAFAAFLISPGVVTNQLYPNVEWLPLLGVLLKPRWGLLLLAVKPQVGAGVALIWLIQAWQAGKLRSVVRTFAPVSIALLISIAFYGFWFARMLGLPAKVWNTSLFPWSLPIGIALLYYAARRLRPDWAISATVLCSPYVWMPSWSGVFLSFARHKWAMLAACVGFWMVRIVVFHTI